MRMLPRLAVLLLMTMWAVSCAPKAEKTASNEVNTEPSASPLQGKLLKGWLVGLANRQPSPGATMAKTLGTGALNVTLTEGGQSWYQVGDVDSNGTEEKIGFMWNAKDKVMYAYTQDPVTLSDGTVADKGLLIAQFGEGNTANRAAGSGWYAYPMESDSTAHGAEGTVYGCTFDKTGTILECGTGTFERNGGDIKILHTPQ